MTSRGNLILENNQDGDCSEGGTPEPDDTRSWFIFCKGKDRKCLCKAGEERMEAHRRLWKEEAGIDSRRC